MNRKLKRLAAVSITAAIAAGSVLMSVPALAANYTPVSVTADKNPTFTKYLIIGAGDRVPNVTFEYEITAGTARSLDTSANDEMEVRAGITPELITINKAVFVPSDTTSATDNDTGKIDVRRTDRTSVKFEKAKGEKFVTKTLTADFTNVAFPEPGVYRYVITEKSSSNNAARGIIHDDDIERIMDVYITDNGSGSLQVSSFVLHMNDAKVTISDETKGSADVTADGVAVTDKTDGFTNEYKSSDIAFKTEVTGNQGSRDKYFKFTLNLSELTPEDEFVVSLADDGSTYTVIDGSADAHIDKNPNTATTVITADGGVNQPVLLKANSEGKVTQDFYLQHGQSIVVRGLPYNASYSLTEDEEDYSKTAAVVTNYTNPVSGTVNAIAASPGDDLKTSYKNLRSGIVPTGILMTVIPGALVVLGGGAGIGLLKARSRRKKEEE